MAAVAFPEIFQRNVAHLVDYCHQRVGVIRKGVDLEAFYRELREHAEVSVDAGPAITDIAFILFLLDKVQEVRAKKS